MDHQRKTHLDASVIPVERALIQRAAVLEAETHSEATDTIGGAVKLLVSQEFRAMAEELHFW